MIKLPRHGLCMIFAVTAFASGCQSDPDRQGEQVASEAGGAGEAAHAQHDPGGKNAGSGGAPARSGASSAATMAAQAAAVAGASGAQSAAGSAAKSGEDSNTPAAGSVGSSTAAAAGSSASAAAGSGAAGAAGAPPRLPAVTTTKGQGPLMTKQDLATGPSGQSGVFWPSELGQNGVLHPIFVWGCGGGTTPTTYAELMSTIASYGFVVIAETSTVDDKGAPLKAAIDWMLAENERMGGDFFHKLDVSKVGLGGHSIGSANAFLVADDPRLTTSIHVAGGSLDMAGDINAATTGSGGKRLTHPVAYVCSESDQFGNVEKTEKDYEQTTVPAWMTVMSGVDHVGAAREGMPAIVAWLRWQLADESERRAAFLDEGGEFTTGMYVSKNKNW